MNPFLLKGYKSAKYFCDRKEESEKLINAIQNNQDITLYAYRRLGKSALIHHVFNKLKKEHTCIYTDIWGTSTIEEFTKELANGVIKSSLFVKRKLSEKLSSFLKSIGASFSIGMDGSPTIDMIYNNDSNYFKSLEEIFYFLNKSNAPIVIAIDEFQEIKKYNSKIPFEGKLRTLIQQSNNITFLFSGSEHHLLNEIFSTYNKPFYQSTRMISIDKIDKKKYREFILRQFKAAKKEINQEIINHILDITHTHTYYVQAISNFLYGQLVIPSNISEFNLLFKDFIMEKSVFYSELPERLTTKQFSVLKSFAKESKVISPMSGEFLSKTNLKSTSSMQRVVNSLLDKQLLIKDNGAFRLYDVFLEHFLRLSM